ncbi:ORC-CDC6 family AAA ATPase [Dickeya ananatis]|uniref:ORC-CDC6 family AAA ATPase n=1 Tax=Dickeya ananatis TaxID=3061286 RepID=UPI00388E3EC9
MHNLFGFNNIFEHSNARYFTSNQLAEEFVWTPAFESLISNKNHIILGSRGSGKTALIKMLSHECLTKLNDEKARKIIDQRSFIATYIPLKVEWVNSIGDIDDNNQLFKWSLNLSSCARFLDTIRSCLHSYIENEIDRVIKEKSICNKISELWLSKKLNTITDIYDELEITEYKKNIIFNKMKLGLKLSNDDIMVGLNFNTDLFKPLIMALSTVRKEIGFSNSSTFCVCIDEAEFLTKEHHRILNTHMRSYNEIVFKITTMPYRHYTLETVTGTPLNMGHDFDYLNIDKQGLHGSSNNNSHSFFENFADKLFRKRINNSSIINKDITLEFLLGNSILVDSPKDALPDDKLMEKVREYCDSSTIKRAERLLEQDYSLFESSVSRKLRGTLILKDSFQRYKGNASPFIFSGYSLIVRCSDGNPRRLLRLFNYLFSNNIESCTELKPLSDKEQGAKLKEFSYSELDGLNLEVDGKKAFDLFTTIGRFLKDKLHTDKINTDTYNSFSFDVEDDNVWKYIETAVDLGLIYPDFRGLDNDNKMPNRKGRFSLAFCLSPHFYLMPRKGNSIKLSVIMNNSSYSRFKAINKNNDDGQYSLEWEGDDE